MTQQQKVVAIMCKYKRKEWWKPQDIMNLGDEDLYVGYEASARLSELARDFPSMVESRRAGKYFERRLRFETGRDWYPTLPHAIQSVIKKYYQREEITA